jgi:CheY-like chemotaxis protein
VDDEEPIASLGARTLQQLGYPVTSKVSSVEALYLLASAPDSFDAVISDFTMPQMSEREPIARLKPVRADIPIISDVGSMAR